MFYYIPYRNLNEGNKWKESLIKWKNTAKWILLGAFLYKIIKGYLPDIVCALAESFGISQTLYIYEHELVALDGSISSILGLLVGIYYFSKKGIKNFLQDNISI